MPIATLYQWRYLGTGPTAYRVGRHLRYEPAAVQAWLDQRAKALQRPERGTWSWRTKERAAVPAVLYRVDEAADALRLSRSLLYELIRSGRLRTVKAGRRRLVPVAGAR